MHINIILHKLKNSMTAAIIILFLQRRKPRHREINLSKITKVVNSEVGIQTPDVCGTLSYLNTNCISCSLQLPNSYPSFCFHLTFLILAITPTLLKRKTEVCDIKTLLRVGPLPCCTNFKSLKVGPGKLILGKGAQMIHRCASKILRTHSTMLYLLKSIILKDLG